MGAPTAVRNRVEHGQAAGKHRREPAESAVPPDHRRPSAERPPEKDFLRYRWLDQSGWFEAKSAYNQRRYYALRIVVVIGGVTVPALVTSTSARPMSRRRSPGTRTAGSSSRSPARTPHATTRPPSGPFAVQVEGLVQQDVDAFIAARIRAAQAEPDGVKGPGAG